MTSNHSYVASCDSILYLYFAGSRARTCVHIASITNFSSALELQLAPLCCADTGARTLVVVTAHGHVTLNCRGAPCLMAEARGGIPPVLSAAQPHAERVSFEVVQPTDTRR